MVFGRLGTFMIGAGSGAYVAQNYQIPNVASTVAWGVERARALEQEMKKPVPSGAAPGLSVSATSASLVAAQLSPSKIR